MLQLEIMDQSENIIKIHAQNPDCEGFAVCQAIKTIASSYLSDVINLELLELGHNPFASMILCQDIFPMCL